MMASECRSSVIRCFTLELLVEREVATEFAYLHVQLLYFTTFYKQILAYIYYCSKFTE